MKNYEMPLQKSMCMMSISHLYIKIEYLEHLMYNQNSPANKKWWNASLTKVIKRDE